MFFFIYTFKSIFLLTKLDIKNVFQKALIHIYEAQSLHSPQSNRVDIAFHNLLTSQFVKHLEQPY